MIFPLKKTYILNLQYYRSAVCWTIKIMCLDTLNTTTEILFWNRSASVWKQVCFRTACPWQQTASRPRHEYKVQEYVHSFSGWRLQHPNIWVNYNISLTWIVRPFGDDFPYINHDFQGSGEQWGRYNLPSNIFPHPTFRSFRFQEKTNPIGTMILVKQRSITKPSTRLQKKGLRHVP